MFPSNDSLKAQLAQNGYVGDVNTSLVRYLRNLYSITDQNYNNLLYYHLGQLGYTGSLNDRIRRWDGLLWSPLALFQASEQGVWYDPSDFSSMFQDNAGTTPVTAVGQPVGKINDKSGRGNHATQVTSTARPTLQQDSTGRYYLSFDGVDDFLVTGVIDFSATDSSSIFVGVRSLNNDTGEIVELSASTALNTGTFALRRGSSVGAAAAYSTRSRGTAAALATQSANGLANWPAPTTNTLIGLNDISLDLSSIYVNGTLETSGSTDKGLGNWGAAYPLYIGMRGGTTNPFNGRIYSLVVRGTISSASEITSAERYINNKTGAY